MNESNNISFYLSQSGPIDQTKLPEIKIDLSSMFAQNFAQC